ncbi:MAG: SIMPL domain-containing protein [Alphaproteobacteria bacterium]|jgi:uncharacterized protein YggE|nr:SIMPL domain-containing protein [Alphaproteobacteria bacterium]
MKKILLTAVAVFAITTNANAMMKSAKENITRSISTKGTCIAKVKSDKIKVSIKISSFDKASSQNSLEKTKSKNLSLEQYIQSLNVSGLEMDTNNISVFEDKYWDEKDRKYKRNGFKAEITLDVIIPMQEKDYAGKIITKATTFEEVSINNFYTYISTKKLEDSKMSCLGKAVSNAKAKADIIATSAGLKVAKMLTANDNTSFSQPAPYYMNRSAVMSMAKSDMMEESSPINIQTKDEEVKVNISTSWEVK